MHHPKSRTIAIGRKEMKAKQSKQTEERNHVNHSKQTYKKKTVKDAKIYNKRKMKLHNLDYPAAEIKT